MGGGVLIDKFSCQWSIGEQRISVIVYNVTKSEILFSVFLYHNLHDTYLRVNQQRAVIIDDKESGDLGVGGFE
jgi:hypothetical protein